MTEGTETTPMSSDRVGVAILALVSALLALLVVLPYLQYVLLGAVLAYVLAPAQRTLERHVSPTAAAGALIAGALLVLTVPIVYVLAVALRQASELVATVQDRGLDLDAIERRLATVGYEVDLDAIFATFREHQEQIGEGLQGVAIGAIELIGGLPAVMIGITITLFVLFALLRDGDRLLAWFRAVSPLGEAVEAELFAELDRLMWASVVGNVAVSGVQALLLGVGLALLGVPGVVFLAVATFILGLLPLIGAFAVWLPLSLYLFAVGRPLAAALLFVYGSLVSVSDTYLRPIIIGHSGALSSAIIVVGIFGGIAVFGAVGLLIGPVVLGAAKVALDLFAREWIAPGGTERRNA